MALVPEPPGPRGPEQPITTPSIKAPERPLGITEGVVGQGIAKAKAEGINPDTVAGAVTEGKVSRLLGKVFGRRGQGTTTENKTPDLADTADTSAEVAVGSDSTNAEQNAERLRGEIIHDISNLTTIQAQEADARRKLPGYASYYEQDVPNHGITLKEYRAKLTEQATGRERQATASALVDKMTGAQEQIGQGAYVVVEDGENRGIVFLKTWLITIIKKTSIDGSWLFGPFFIRLGGCGQNIVAHL